MSDVFISYAHEDTAFVDRLRAALTARGREVWVDTSGIEPADRWRVSAHEAIERSDALLFVISVDSLGSEPCIGEFEHAVSLNKRVIPVCVTDAAVDMDKPPLLGELSWIMMREHDEFEAGVTAIVHALDTDLEVVRTHTRILVRAKAWELAGRRASPLLRGEELRLAEQWLARASASGSPPTELQQEFIAASRRAATRRLGIVAAVFAFVAVIAVALSIFALIQRSHAVANQKAALSRALASEAQDAFNVQGGQPDRGVLLSLEAYRQAPTDAARASVLTALEYTDRVAGFIPVGSPVADLAFAPNGSTLTAAGGSDFAARSWDPASLHGGGSTATVGASMTARALSPDGRYVAEISTGGTRPSLHRVLVRDLSSPGAPPVALFASGDVATVAVTSAGEVVVGATTGIETWTLSPRRRTSGPFRLGRNDFSMMAVAASADGSVLAGRTDAGAIIVVDARRHRSVELKVPGVKASYQFGALSLTPDGRLLAAGFGGGYYVLWRIDANGVPHQLGAPRQAGSGADVSAIRFGPGARLIAVGKTDGTAQLWRVRTAFAIMNLREDGRRIDALAFNPAGTQVAIGGADNHVTLWDILLPGGRYTSPLADLLPLPDKSGVVDQLAYSPRRAVLAVAGFDGGLRFYDAQSGRPFGPGTRIGRYGATAISFDPAGNTLVTLSYNRAIRAFDVRDPRSPKVLAEPQSAGAALPTGTGTSAISPDGRTIAVVTASRHNIALIDRLHPQRPAPLLSYADPTVHGSDVLNFNRSGTVLAAGNSDGSLDLWNLGRHQRTATALAPRSSAQFSALAFSPDGRTMAAALRNDGTFSLWDTVARQAITGLGSGIGAANGSITSLQFSPDGAMLATGDTLGYLRLWDVARGQPFGRPLPSTDAPGAGIYELSFSPDGGKIAIAGGDGTLISLSRLLWPGTRSAARERRLCAIAGRNLTHLEWSAFVPGIGYQATCPQWGTS